MLLESWGEGKEVERGWSGTSSVATRSQVGTHEVLEKEGDGAERHDRRVHLAQQLDLGGRVLGRRVPVWRGMTGGMSIMREEGRGGRERGLTEHVLEDAERRPAKGRVSGHHDDLKQRGPRSTYLGWSVLS